MENVFLRVMFSEGIIREEKRRDHPNDIYQEKMREVLYMENTKEDIYMRKCVHKRREERPTNIHNRKR